MDVKYYLHTVDNNSFLEKLLPSHTPSTAIFKRLKDEKLYGEHRWAEYPLKPRTCEKRTLYKLFVATCNAITDAIPEDALRNKIIYFDRHSSVPCGPYSDMAAARPNGAGASNRKDVEELEIQIANHEGPAHPHPVNPRTRKAEEDMATNNSTDNTKHLIKLYILWWMQVHVVFEVTDSLREWYGGVTRILTYMRQTLLEQLDRRFILGLLLCFDELTVVMCDRSVLLEFFVDQIQEPERFIDILAGLSCMRPEELGWDTAMKIYLPLSDTIVPSYRVGANFQGIYEDTRYHLHWIIDVVVGGVIVQYITVSIIAPPTLAEVCGRATVVYRVIKFDERSNPVETLALKRYWRPINKDHPEWYPSEGEVYKILDEGMSPESKHIRAAHDITIDSKLDSTFKLIRHGLKSQRYVRLVASNPFLPEPVDRYHTNILMPVGEVIRAASSHQELLKCFRDFVTDHQNAHRRLILQRDISGGNLLIFTDENGQAFGRLMDYDHARKAEKALSIPYLEHEALENLKELNVLLIFHRAMQYTWSRTESAAYEVDDSVALEAIRRINCVSEATEYVVDVIKARYSLPASGTDGDTLQKLCKADLGWNEVEEWPFYGDRKHQLGLNRERTGTLPYMSEEVISGCASYPSRRWKSKVSYFVHEAIHDIESLLWVLVQMCMTHKGPGIDMKRLELDKHSESYSPDLRQAIVSYFDGEESILRASKRSLLSCPSRFESEIIAHFHPYFDPLKELVRQWWSLLILGYKHRGIEFYNIHSHIIRIIDKALSSIPIPDTPNEDTVKELERRAECRRRHLDTFKGFALDDTSTMTPPRSPQATSRVINMPQPPSAKRRKIM
ncbi:hypothetical protein DXG01_003564 [Tephrocybe rancida]|nr:hypothetical protein DXG01_003564 [Tephrocybe rancida]